MEAATGRPDERPNFLWEAEVGGGSADLEPAARHLPWRSMHVGEVAGVTGELCRLLFHLLLCLIF